MKHPIKTISVLLCLLASCPVLAAKYNVVFPSLQNECKGNLLITLGGKTHTIASGRSINFDWLQRQNSKKSILFQYEKPSEENPLQRQPVKFSFYAEDAYDWGKVGLLATPQKTTCQELGRKGKATACLPLIFTLGKAKRVKGRALTRLILPNLVATSHDLDPDFCYIQPE